MLFRKLPVFLGNEGLAALRSSIDPMLQSHLFHHRGRQILKERERLSDIWTEGPILEVPNVGFEDRIQSHVVP